MYSLALTAEAIIRAYQWDIPASWLHVPTARSTNPRSISMTGRVVNIDIASLTDFFRERVGSAPGRSIVNFALNLC